MIKYIPKKPSTLEEDFRDMGLSVEEDGSELEETKKHPEGSAKEMYHAARRAAGKSDIKKGRIPNSNAHRKLGIERGSLELKNDDRFPKPRHIAKELGRPLTKADRAKQKAVKKVWDRKSPIVGDSLADKARTTKGWKERGEPATRTYNHAHRKDAHYSHVKGDYVPKHESLHVEMERILSEGNRDTKEKSRFIRGVAAMHHGAEAITDVPTANQGYRTTAAERIAKGLKKMKSAQSRAKGGKLDQGAVKYAKEIARVKDRPSAHSNSHESRGKDPILYARSNREQAARRGDVKASGAEHYRKSFRRFGA